MKTKKQFLGVLKKYSKCDNIMFPFKPHSLHVCQIVISPYFISVRMKSQVVLSTGEIFKTIFIAELQSNSYQLSIVSLATCLYQL